MMKVFISYASQDKDTAEAICEYLEKNNKKCWIAPRDIRPGKEYGEEIIKGIEQSDVLVLIYSYYSNQSQHVLREVERAVSKNIPIISYNLDDTVLSKSLEYFLLATQRLDATRTSQTTIALLNESIDRLLSEEIFPEDNPPDSNPYDKAERKPNAKPGRNLLTRNKLTLAFGLIIVCLLSVTLLLYTGIIPGIKQSFGTTPNPPGKPDFSTSNLNTGTDDTVGTSADNIGNDNTDSIALDDAPADTLANNTMDENAASKDAVGTQASSQHENASSDTISDLTSSQEGPLPSAEPSSRDKVSASSDSPSSLTGEATATRDTSSPVEKTNATSSTTEEADKGTQAPDTGRKENTDLLSIIKEGSYLKFGRYYPSGYKEENKDGELLWVVTEVDKAKGTITLVSQYIIDVLPFDSAESGDFDTDKNGTIYDRNKKDTYSLEQMIEFRGNSSWKHSNIRTWLNSSVASVSYSDGAPKDKATDEYRNGYHTKNGFLHNFTDFELSLLKEKKNTTIVNALYQKDDQDKHPLPNGKFTDYFEASNATYETTKDKVYLLSMPEVIDYSKKGIFQTFTRLTASAAASDQSTWSKVYATKEDPNYIWATRTPYSDASHMVVTVSNGNLEHDYHTFYAAASGFGIRPALVIAPKDCSITGLGKLSNPYELKEE